MSTIQQHNESEINRLFFDMENELMHRIRVQLDMDDINFTHEMSKNIEIENTTKEHILALTSPYAKPVEYGLPAGNRVNYDALRNWVKKKLGVSDEELDTVTSKIFNKIRVKGIKPKRPVKKAIKAMIHNDKSPVRRKLPIKKKSRFSKALKKVSKYVKKVYKTTKKVYKVTKQIYKSSKVRRSY